MVYHHNNKGLIFVWFIVSGVYGYSIHTGDQTFSDWDIPNQKEYQIWVYRCYNQGIQPWCTQSGQHVISNGGIALWYGKNYAALIFRPTTMCIMYGGVHAPGRIWRPLPAKFGHSEGNTPTMLAHISQLFWWLHIHC